MSSPPWPALTVRWMRARPGHGKISVNTRSGQSLHDQALVVHHVVDGEVIDARWARSFLQPA